MLVSIPGCGWQIGFRLGSNRQLSEEARHKAWQGNAITEKKLRPVFPLYLPDQQLKHVTVVTAPLQITEVDDNAKDLYVVEVMLKVASQEVRQITGMRPSLADLDAGGEARYCAPSPLSPLLLFLPLLLLRLISAA